MELDIIIVVITFDLDRYLVLLHHRRGNRDEQEVLRFGDLVIERRRHYVRAGQVHVMHVRILPFDGLAEERPELRYPREIRPTGICPTGG